MRTLMSFAVTRRISPAEPSSASFGDFSSMQKLSLLTEQEERSMLSMTYS